VYVKHHQHINSRQENHKCLPIQDFINKMIFSSSTQGLLACLSLSLKTLERPFMTKRTNDYKIKTNQKTSKKSWPT